MLPEKFERWMPYSEVTLIGAALLIAAIAYGISQFIGN
jgi:hypothetical protein